MKGAVGIRLATANNAVARRLLGILKKQYELPTNVLVRQGLNLRKKNMYTLSVEPSIEAVSYTHLDVYKRQGIFTSTERLRYKEVELR